MSLADPARAMARALSASANRAGCPVRILSTDLRDWASATFTGHRQRLRLRAPASPALDAWLAGLAEAEWRVAGHCVADLVVDAAFDVDSDVTVSVLTIRES